MKRKRIGMIVWGVILLGIGLFILITGNIATQGSKKIILFIWLCSIPLITGTFLLSFGIIDTVRATRYNNEILKRNELYVTNCIYCGRLFSRTAKYFRFHRNFPEGYTNCPYCKRHISKNTFDIRSGCAPQNGNTPQN